MQCHNNSDSFWRTISKLVWQLGRCMPSSHFAKELQNKTILDKYNVEAAQPLWPPIISPLTVKGGDLQHGPKRNDCRSSRKRPLDLSIALLLSLHHPHRRESLQNGQPYYSLISVPKGSFTLAAVVCGFCSRLCQCRDRNNSISLCKHNRLLHAAASNAVSANSLNGFMLAMPLIHWAL